MQIDGFTCVIQEMLSYIKDFNMKNLPEWVGSVDCGQVGYDKKRVDRKLTILDIGDLNG